MARKIPMRDMVILLPGVMGSVLQKDGKDIWAPSVQGVWQYLSHPSRSVDALELKGDDPEKDDLGDGIRATKLMPDIHFVPGFWKIDGYSEIRDFLMNTFQLIPGDLDDGPPANYFEFPYDWRRDIRFTAKKLKLLIDRELPKWRNRQPKAKVILIGHSMGGVVSRYYVEVLEGWINCRVLITFGAPFRGSVDVLKYLEEGYKMLFLDFNNVVRTFTSAYQLLPRYKVIREIDLSGVMVNRRIADFNKFKHIDQKRAKAALEEFHFRIDEAVDQNKQQNAYREEFKTIPIVGFGQKTLQSAQFSNGRLTFNYDLLDDSNPILEDGDGRVPRLSAIPIELSNASQEWFVNQKHASIQNTKNLLEELGQKLAQLQVSGLENFRAPSEEGETTVGIPAIGLELEDLYLKDEPVIIQATVANFNNPGTLLATVRPISKQGSPSEKTFHHDGEQWSLDLSELEAGLYRITVRTQHLGPGAPTSVSDVFEVVR